VLLLALRAGGEEVGWAFQLQEPLVVAALLLLAAAITANLLGVYEFSVPGFASGSPQGAFATGLLAAFAATPCTGPFMAAAMGAALLLPAAAGAGAVRCTGTGPGLPFLALATIPRCAAACPARAVDGRLPPLDGAADGPDRAGAGLAGQPARRQAPLLSPPACWW
jgi:thiol:disulfide interchange protein